MLNIYYGTTGTGKSAAMMNRIREEAELIQKSGESRSICVIVPDQFTFEYEHMLYNSMGCKLFNSGNTEVWSFSRLIRDIFSRSHSPEGQAADSTVKTAVMYKSIKKAVSEDALLYYKKQASRPNFTATAMTIISELIHSGVTPEIMGELAGKAPENMREKLTDVFLIYSRFTEELSKLGLRDPMLDSRIAAECARECGYFKGMSIFMDEFKSFTGDQYGLMETMLADCTYLTVCLTADSLSASGYSPFTAVTKTAARIMSIADKLDVKTEAKKFTENKRYKNEGLFALSDKLMRLPRAKNAASGEAVTVVSAPDIYSECDYICSEIKRLISEDKTLRYKDIAVLSRNMNDDISILSAAFERYDIPYYSDKKQSAAHKRLMIMINAALELASAKRISTEALLRYAKTGLAKPPAEYEKDGEICSVYSLEPDEELLKLENYCYTWDIDGELWEKPFPETDEAYKGIDDIKNRLLAPILALRKDCADKTGAEICRAIRKFMASIPAEENLLEFTSLPADENVKTGGKYCFDDRLEKRENERLLAQLDSILSGLETALPDKISLSEFREIFTLSASGITLSSPPEALDSVAAQQSDLARLSEPRIVFVMHANDGVFPFVTGESVTFSEREREFFRESEHDLSGNVKNRIEEERFNAFKALCSPSEKLYVSCEAASSDGSLMYPSALISEICCTLEGVNRINTDELDMLFFCRTKESAYAAATAGFDAQNADFATVRAELSKDPVYKSRFEYIESIDTGTEHHIGDRELSKRLYGSNARISPSRFEDFSKCPFMFFCKKGLGIYPLPKNDLNPIIQGNIIHKCMQDIFIKNSKQSFLSLSKEEILASIALSADEYIKDDLGGGFAKKSSFEFYLDIAAELVLKVILHMQEELLRSEFVPVACELPVGISRRNDSDDSEQKKAKLSGAAGEIYVRLYEKLKAAPCTARSDREGGMSVDFSGTADRVDAYIDEKNGGKIYLRIIDYKTGSKEFVRGQLDLGINMQMFFYLWALTRKNGPIDEHSFEAAGVMYVPMKAPKLSMKNRNDDISPEQTEMSSFRMKGEILGDENILTAMQNDLFECGSDSEVFIPAKLKFKDGEAQVSNVFTKEELCADINKAEMLLKGLARALDEGYIPASPLSNKKLKCACPCDNCDYAEVCGNYPSPKTRSGSIFPADNTETEETVEEN
ncbi:MAG: PD-(D/E)XK nuclease family protein [Oscillospiraceae bacterium]|nr:PD-(D/E)XK nuclease family protein [Oscillospiraceae bacterium]